MAFVEDLSIFLSDFGRPVIAGAQTGLGILDMPGEYVLGDRVINNQHVLTAEASKFGGLSYGDSLTVDGQPYAVKEGPLSLADGAFCAILLEIIEALESIGTIYAETIIQAATIITAGP